MQVSKTIKRNANKEGIKTLLYLLAAALIVMFFTKIVKGFNWVTNSITGFANDKDIIQKADVQKNQVQKLISDSGFSQSTLPRPQSYYDNIADTLEDCMKGWGTKSAEMRPLLENLTSNELKAVYLSFGSRINEDFQNDAGNLFTWFGWELGNYSPFDWGALDKMRAIWKKTLLPLTF